MKYFFLLLVVTFTIFKGKAQDFNNYKPLKSSGEIPEVFQTKATSKVINDLKKIDKEQKRVVRKGKESFILHSSFAIDQLLKSGIVLFNDPLTDYINDVADYLLKDEPELRNKLQFYTIKSSAVNSFCTNNGIVFVTIGLLSQLENEAQLAYILSHEIIHFNENHVIDSYVESILMNQSKGQYKNLDYNTRKLIKLNYSKENETQADIDGFNNYFSKTDYDKKQAINVFDVLLYSYLPFEDLGFEKTIFENKYLKFKEKTLLDEEDEISAEDEYEDREHDHPNIKKRKEKIIQLIEDGNFNEVDKLFIVSEESFYSIRKIARYELPALYIRELDYLRAAYTSLLLLESNPDSKYLNTKLAYALYGMSKYKNEYSLNDVNENYKSLESDIQSMSYFFKKASTKSLNILAVQKLWELKLKFPDDRFIQKLSEDVLKELIVQNELTINDFHESPQLDTIHSEAETVDAEKLTKTERIKRNKKKKKESYTYAFVDLLENNEFKQTFSELSEEFENYNPDKDELSYSQKKKYDRLHKKYGAKLGIDTVVLTTPIIIRQDQRKKNKTLYFSVEEIREQVLNNYLTCAKDIDLNIHVIDNQGVIQSDVAMFNENAVIFKWLFEQIIHGDIDIINSNLEEIYEIADKYGTNYFAWNLLETYRIKKSGLGYVILLTALVPYILPLSVYYLFSKTIHVGYHSLLFDVESGQLMLKEDLVVRANNRNDIQKAYIYDTLFQIKKSQKK